MKGLINRQWTIARHPETGLTPEDFGYREVPVPALPDGAMLLKTLYLNVAPVMRLYMLADGGGKSPEKLLGIGDVIHGRGVAQVIESRHSEFVAGDVVHGQLGWQTYKVTTAETGEKFVKMQPRAVPAYYGLSALGMTGYSAYCGFFTRGEPKAGDAVLVSGAAGGVGSLVVQMAKAMGCAPVVGIAGTDAKCAAMLERGADHMINYRDENVAERIAGLFPAGVNLYFDNVGGEILEAALDHLAFGARVVLCGAISEYTRDEPFGPRNYTNLRGKSADMRGFFVYNHAENFDEAETRIAQWIKEDKVRVLVDIYDGFEKAPEALMGLFTGENMGKCIVRVDKGRDLIY